MRAGRRERQDTRRRQEQEYRNVLAEQGIKTVNIDVDATILAERQLVPIQEVPRVSPEVPRIVLPRSNLRLVILAYGLGTVGLGINAWFAWNRGTDLIDKGLLSFLGFTTEAMAFYLPDQATRLWMQRRLVGFCFASILCVILFVSALINGLGFASLNLTEASTVRSERITPAVADAQRKLDTLSASRRDECQKRGDRCRQLEKEEQLALESLRDTRDKVTASSDPQIASAAKLVAWVSFGRYHPSADDFAMLRLFLLTLLPQLGGLVLMVASRSK